MERDAAEPPDAEPRHPATGPPTLNSKDLFAHGREVLVQHGAEIYRLRLTNSNKLLLVK